MYFYTIIFLFTVNCLLVKQKWIIMIKTTKLALFMLSNNFSVQFLIDLWFMILHIVIVVIFMVDHYIVLLTFASVAEKKKKSAKAPP